MLIYFLGEPGTGKGTISEILVEKHAFKHISTGDIFREQINSNTELGNKVKALIASGNLVDDKTTWEIAKLALESFDLVNDKVILDGYPRNIAQVGYIEEWIKEKSLKDAIPILFVVPEDIILERLTGRRMCKECGKVYHTIFVPPKQKDMCDIDGSVLYQRADDKPENVQVRLDVYKNITQPMIDMFVERKTIKMINAYQDKNKSTEDTLKVLECL